MEIFAKIINGLQLLTISAKNPSLMFDWILNTHIVVTILHNNYGTKSPAEELFCKNSIKLTAKTLVMETKPLLSRIPVSNFSCVFLNLSKVLCKFQISCQINSLHKNEVLNVNSTNPQETMNLLRFTK